MQQEFLGIAELGDVAGERFEHFALIDFRQDLEKPAQFLGADVVVPTLADQLDYVVVRAVVLKMLI